MSTQFGKAEYWEKRYLENKKTFDWYQNYDGIKDIVTQFISKDSKILNVGCGSSDLSHRMFQEGYSHIKNIDQSITIIDQMNLLYGDIQPSSYTYEFMDARNMRKFANDQFDCVIDKALLDTILCGEYSTLHSTRLLNEISRVLAPNGVYICISYGLPQYRMNFIDKAELNWQISQFKIYKPNVQPDNPNYNEKDQDNFHYVYCCRKTKQNNQAQSKRMSVMGTGFPPQ